MSAKGWLLVPAVALGLTLFAALLPFGLRHMDAFRVERIEVAGARYMSPEAALEATGITDSSTVFDDFEPWTEALLAERMVEDARLVRKLPNTVRIDLVEAEPVALVRTPELRPVDARGRLLPVSLEGKDLDAPIVAHRVKLNEDSTTDEATTALLTALLEIRAHDAALAAAVSEIGVARGGGIRLRLRVPRDAELLLPSLPDARTLREIRMAMEHLRSEAAEAGAGSAFDRLARIEARYPDELFVLLRPDRTD